MIFLLETVLMNIYNSLLSLLKSRQLPWVAEVPLERIGKNILQPLNTLGKSSSGEKDLSSSAQSRWKKQNHWNLTNLELEEQIIDCEFDSLDFTHMAHLRLARHNIHTYGAIRAEKNIRIELQEFFDLVGPVDKYNDTLTVASLRIVQHFMEKSESNTFKEFIAEFPILCLNFKGLISCHYGFDIYRSAEAKQKYLAPDLMPFG